jgi:hypothetical protein
MSMTKFRGDVVQAVPLIEGQIAVSTGTYEAKGLIHADVDATITLPYPSGVQTVTLLAGEDRGYVGEFTVTSGTVTYA